MLEKQPYFPHHYLAPEIVEAIDESRVSSGFSSTLPSETAPQVPSQRASGRIPSLDGLRAISILLVLFGHARDTTGFPTWLGFLGQYSVQGVRIFFVISGFLITTLLLRERERTGRISMRAFYKRRAFRILPAATVTVAVIALFWRPGWGSALAALFFIRNYVGIDWYTGHFWSLSIEEQFYFLWPFLLARFFAHRKAIAIGGILLGPIARMASYAITHRTVVWFPCIQDSLATGCLLALMQTELERWRPWIDRLAIPIAAAALLLYRFRYPIHVQPLVITTIVNVAIALSIDHCIRKEYRVLDWSPVVWVGVLSYSLYLWQQPFLLPGSKLWYNHWPLNFVLAFAAAILCHYFVEQPFLNLRKRAA
jgi:peptidoglycan/LPS O-acetylase OafA/YrhL